METPKKQPSILVVEDDATIRTLLQMSLGQRGFSVTTAQNGQIALDCLAKDDFDVIITDMNMPVMDGAELLKELKSRRDHEYNILVISASAGYDRDELIENGALAVLPKPCDMNTLVDKANEILRFRGPDEPLRGGESFSCRLEIPSRETSIHGTVRNLSIDGALIEVEEEPDILTGVALHLSMPFEKMYDDVCAEVVDRRPDGPGPAKSRLIIYFDRNKKEDLLKHLQPFIHRRETAEV